MQTPSLWMTRFARLIRPGGNVLDLACGTGRNARWLAEQGWNVLAVDRDPEALSALAGIRNISTRCMDLEGKGWPFTDCRFDGIVVCRYLYRPFLPLLAENLNENGVLIYETFMVGQEQLGRPRNPDYLLQSEELLQAYAGSLQTISFEQGLMSDPGPAFIQRICARRCSAEVVY